MATLGDTIGAIKKRKGMWDEAAGVAQTTTPRQTTPAPKMDAFDKAWEDEKRAWEKKTGRKWVD